MWWVIKLINLIHQGLRNVRFSENLVCFIFSKHPFWDSPFCLITVVLYHRNFAKTRSTENWRLLNQLMLNTSLIGRKLLILGDFNFPIINWDNKSTSHLSNHCASEFLAATQDTFLFQYVQSPAHSRSNQKLSLTEVIFSQDDQSITNMISSAPLG